MFRSAEHRPDSSLEVAARAIAADERTWLPLVRFAEPRAFEQLDVSAVVAQEVEAWLLTWLPGQCTGFHDHGGADGVFAVLRGRIGETWLDAAGAFRSRRYAAGLVRSFGVQHVHDVFNDSDSVAVTLHLYRPHLEAMTRYEREGSALRPLETARAGVDW